MKTFHWFAISLLVVLACDPCEDCGEPLQFEPLVKLILINGDSLNEVEDLIDIMGDSLNEYDSLNNVLEIELDSLLDVFDSLKALIDSGQVELQDELDLVDELIGLQEEQIPLNDSISNILDSIYDYWVNVEKVVESGKVAAGTVTIVNGNSLLFSDSVDFIHVPLLMNAETDMGTTRYIFELGDERDTLTLVYELFIEVDATREIKRRARNIQIADHTFNAAEAPDCDINECLERETTITLYY